MEAYLGRFFSPSLTSKRRKEISVFNQGEDESLYTTWERFKRLLKRCPMHGLDLKTQMDIFYHSMNDTSKGIIDASCCGAFKIKSAEEARDFIEDLARWNMKNPSESSGSNSRARGNGIIEFNKMTAMEAKLDAIMHLMDRQDKRFHSAHEIRAIDREGMRRSAEGLVEEDPYQVEEANYLNEQRSYHFKPNLNLPTHYNPVLRNHENFSYGGEAIHGPRYTIIQHSYVSSKHRCITKELGNTSRAASPEYAELEQGLFPSDTQENPKDCMEIQFRSGKEVSSSSKKENKEKTDEEEK